MLTVDELWNSSDSKSWNEALQRYWEFVKPANRALERKLEKLDFDDLRLLDSKGWFDFLRDQYFRWRYTDKKWYATTTRYLHRYVEDGSLDELHNIKRQLLSLNLTDIGSALNKAKEIRGLGTPGASGLLALMYPRLFGTVDQFVVKALRNVKALPEAGILGRMNENSLTIQDGVILIQVLQRKAAVINRLFGTEEWTPRLLGSVIGVSVRFPSSAKPAPWKSYIESASTNWQVVVGGSPIRGRNGESPWPRVMRSLIARWDAKR